MTQCELCELQPRHKKLKRYFNDSERAGGTKPMGMMLCESCYSWIDKKMKANHGEFKKW